jgi:hypothetical protein
VTLGAGLIDPKEARRRSTSASAIAHDALAKPRNCEAFELLP